VRANRSLTIPEMNALFGARMTDTVVSSEVTLKIVKPLGNLKVGDHFSFSLPGAAAKFWGTGLQVGDGEVIAVDQDNRPALIAHQFGKGRTLLSAYPIEAWLGSQAAAFEGNELNYRLYRALREWSGVRATVSTDQPSVEAAALLGKSHGYFVLANHGPLARRAHIDSTLSISDLHQLTETGSAAVTVERGGWSLNLPAHSGAVLEWHTRQP
jgi:hypothetical protein